MIYPSLEIYPSNNLFPINNIAKWTFPAKNAKIRVSGNYSEAKSLGGTTKFEVTEKNNFQVISFAERKAYSNEPQVSAKGNSSQQKLTSSPSGKVSRSRVK